MGKNVGIIGGTFNPIHNGHLMLAEHAWSQFKLDEILFIPTGISYFKDQNIVLDKSHRLNMTSLAIENNPHFALSTIETDRKGNSYTYETLTALKEANPDVNYYLICGADTLFQIETWKNPDIIFKLASMLVSVRDLKSISDLEEKANELKLKFNADIKIMQFPLIDISSTDIRDRVKKGLSVRYMLSDAVIEYIDKNGLYR